MIFVDCYATWCGPCVKMDHEVFTDTAVGKVIGEKFVAAKFQMDTTRKDGPDIQAQYSNAAMLAEKYTIKSYPSILFLTPKGELLYRMGYAGAAELLQTVAIALNPEENLDGMMKRYAAKSLDNEGMLKLIALLRKSEMKAKAEKVAATYKEDFLEYQHKDSLISKLNLQFLMSYYKLLNSKDNVFQALLKKPSVADSIFGGKGFARSVTDFIITKEEVSSKLNLNGKPIAGEPAWIAYHKAISTKYGSETANRIIRNRKIIWYNEKQNWPEAIKCYIEKVETEGMDKSPMSMERLNSNVYELIFRHSENKQELAKAAGWLEEMLQENPQKYQWIDTYASLLYKMGKVNEAITWEEKALAMAREKKDGESISFYENIIKKMREGKSIW